MPFTVHPVTPQQYMEPSLPLGGRLLFYASGSYYYVTGAEVGANAVTESTFNLWILKSSDGGVTWTRIVNFVPPGYTNYEFLSAAQSGTRIWIAMHLQSPGAPATAIYSLDTGTDTFTASYPANTAAAPDPAGLAVLPDTTPILVYSSSVARFNGATWDAAVAFPVAPFASPLRAMIWDGSRIYLLSKGGACLTIALPSLTPSTWQTLTLPASPGGPVEIDYPCISNGKLAVPVRVQTDGTPTLDLYMLCGPVADSGSLSLATGLVMAQASLPAGAILTGFDILPWPVASTLDVGGVLHCFYLVSNPYQFDASDFGYLYHQTSTACGAWSAPEILYTSPASNDLITPYPVAAGGSWAVFFGSIDPVLFLNGGPGTKYASLTTFLLAPAVPLAIACNNPPAGTVGTAYTHTLTITGGTAPYVTSLVSGNLPPNLTLTSGGIIAGIPIANGTFNFTVRVVDGASATATVTCSIQIGDCASDTIGGPG